MERDDLFERVRAAKTCISTIRNEEQAEDAEMRAFMAIFHPDFKGEQPRPRGEGE